MTTFVTTANQTLFQTTMASTNGRNLLDQEQIVVAAGATVSSTQASGISGADNIVGTSMLIMGSVLSGGGSTFLLKYAGILTRSGQQKVLIGSSGAVFGTSDGILLSDTASDVGQNFVENRGLVITAAGTGISAKLSDNYLANLGTVEAVRGIQAGSSGSSNNVVVNSGSIFSSGTGVELWGSGSSLTNSGLIRSSGLLAQSSDAAIVLKSNAGDTITVTNTGTIESYLGEEGKAISGDIGSEWIVNSGTIRGYIELGDGNDRYEGKGGTVVGEINMGEGDDSIYGSTFDASVNLAAGNDLYDGRGGKALEVVLLGPGMDTAYGGSHNDSLDGGGENDWLSGGDGDDTLYLETGNDKGFGGSGNDLFRYTGVFGSDTIDGGSGIDEVSLYYNGNVTINLSSTKLQNTGFPGHLQLSGIENASSGTADDLLVGSSIGNRLVALGGQDTLEGGLGNDVLNGGDGSDYARFTGSVGAKVNLAKTSAQVTGYGTDTFMDIEGLMGGSGADSFIGDGKSNNLHGNAGNDYLSGGAEDDDLVGGTGNDTLYGGVGEDVLSGGIGNDKLAGGTGVDSFVFDTKLNAKTNVDVITDFVHQDDGIKLDNAIFKKLTKPNLDKSYFTIGLKAKDKNDYIVYDKTSGALYYDADGSGTGAAVKFAQFKKGTVLAYDDFYVLLPSGEGGGPIKP